LILSRLGLDGAAHVDALSGGWRRRVLLARALVGQPDVLLLDEPTNHLDIDSRTALIEAINEYPGAIVLVSHDRHLLDACAERLWLVSGGKVSPFDGDLNDYRRRVLSDRDGGSTHASTKRNGKPSRDNASRNAPAPRRADAKPLRARITRAEAEIARITREIETLDAALADGSLFTRDPARATAMTKARADHADALARAEEDWLAAGAALEAATG
jgi:ATP-binding cassette subfamily F protein 3